MEKTCFNIVLVTLALLLLIHKGETTLSINTFLILLHLNSNKMIANGTLWLFVLQPS